MKPFLEKFFPEVYRKMTEDTDISNYCKFDSQLLTSFTSSLYVAGLAASFFASSVTKLWNWKDQRGLGLANLPIHGSSPGCNSLSRCTFLPETANSLIQRTDDTERAKLMLQRVRGTEDVEAELNDLIQANSTSKTNKHPFKNIIRRRYRPQLVMAIAIPFFQQVTGINVIAFYAPVLFRTIGQGESASLISSLFPCFLFLPKKRKQELMW